MPLISKKNQTIFKRNFYNVAVEGKKVVCPFCGNDTFQVTSMQMTHYISSALDSQACNPSYSTLICGNCGHMELFMNDVEKLGGVVERK